ncbi:hypothetical protein KSW39_02025 [Bifidobacterium longum]|uniref:hypothetical protein n=1 Tax=Bifidobacterium TaxID=1678 RepID=UPI001C38D6F9|nr:MULTISPECIES: hypothetical protein [Bifidobacterium]MBV3435731.1 hypothetical protein [Bifidobacterium longum]MDF4073063.1 hypothetical protein [Bifidobacterium adolescentis]
MPRYQLTAVPGIIRGGGFLHLQDLRRRQVRVGQIVQRHAKAARNLHHVVKRPRIANLQHARKRLRKLAERGGHILFRNMPHRNNHVDVRNRHVAGRHIGRAGHR